MLHIVRSALWNEPMPEVEISDVLVQLIMQQGVGPLVYPALQRQYINTDKPSCAAINIDKEEIKNAHSTPAMPDGPRGLERNHPQALTSELAAPVDANTPNLLPEEQHVECLQKYASLTKNDKNINDRLVGEWIRELKAVCIQNMQMQAKMQRVLEVAWRALTDAGIRPVLMKGAGLAAYYPEPSMRQWSDIDLFVGKAQYHPACAVMRETFPDALKFDEELEHYKHYNLIADGVAIEIHRVSVALTHPRDIRRYAKMERFGMAEGESLELRGLEVRVPEVTFNVLMVFLHSWEHMLSGGANIRQLCDLALLLKHTKSEIDAVRLKRWLKDLRALDIWQIYMGILVHELGMREEEVLFYNERVVPRAQKMIAWILNDPRQEQPKIQAKNRLVRKWRTMKKRMRNAERIAEISPAYARHMKAAVWLSGLSRLFAPDRRWE